MSEKDHHHVHFDEDSDSFGKDNEIVLQHPKVGKITAHLGFLQVKHRYEITFTLTPSLHEIKETTGLREAYEKIPNVNCKFLEISSDKNNIILKVELFAHKEKLIREDLHLESDDNSLLTISIMARVLGRGKGTPMLKNGIRCIGVEVDEESEASDWQGFE